MPQLGASAPRETELVLVMALALISCCEKQSGPNLAARRDAAQTIKTGRDAALRGVSPVDAMPRDATPKATTTVSRDATPKATVKWRPSPSEARKWRAEVARRLKHMAQPFFVKGRGAGYRKPTTRQCLEREAGLLALIDPLDLKAWGLSFDWNRVLVIYRHKGTAKDARRAAIKLAASLGGCVGDYNSFLEGALKRKREVLERRRMWEEVNPMAPGVYWVRRRKGKRMVRRRMRWAGPLKKARAYWRKEISSLDRLIWRIKNTPCLEGYYQIDLPYRDRAKCQAAARAAAKDRRVRYALCCSVEILRSIHISLPCSK